MKRYARPQQVLYLQRHRGVSILGALGAVPLFGAALWGWKGFIAYIRESGHTSSNAVQWSIVAALPTLLGMFCFGMALGLLRHARLFMVDQKNQMLIYEERPLWILGRARRKCIPRDRIHIHLERVPACPSPSIERCCDAFAWIRIRDEEPILFMRNYEDDLLRESPSCWAQMLANDLSCPLTGES